jgi:signal transduction histidine kinase/ActR/RegA family two-component response regulator
VTSQTGDLASSTPAGSDRAGTDASGSPERYRFGRAIWGVVLPYIVFAGLWILVSDRMLAALIPDPSARVDGSIVQGLGFVAVTALLVTLLLRRELLARARAEAERQALDDQLRQAQKLESVGRLAGGVAHDFNNALGVILSRTDLALSQAPAGGEIERHLELVRQAALHSAQLTRQLLAFARRQTIAPRVLDLNRAVDASLDMLRHLIGENVELSWLPGSEPGRVRMDPAQIDQILANLLVNARDAIGQAGHVTIRTSRAVLEDQRVPGAAPGEYVVLSVADDGCGMAKEVLEQAFEPFFTTKPPGQGTGLGLATVYGIVKQNGGAICVASAPGSGTAFEVYLPAVAGETARDEEPRDEGTAASTGASRTILLVEDEPAMLEVVAEMLGEFGHRVLSAGSAEEAVTLAREHAGPIDLLVTDIIMPTTSGWDLAERLRADRPRTRALFVSGYTADVIAGSSVLADGVRFLQKPFGRRELAEAVRRALDE